MRKRDIKTSMQKELRKPLITVKSQDKKDWNLIIENFLSDFHLEIEISRQKKIPSAVQGDIYIKRQMLRMTHYRMFSMSTELESNLVAEEEYYQNRLKIFFQDDKNSQELIKYFSHKIRVATDQLVTEYPNQILESYKQMLIRVYEYYQQQWFKKSYEHVILFFKDNFQNVFAKANKIRKFKLELNDAKYDEIIQWGKQKDRESKSYTYISFKAFVFIILVTAIFFCLAQSSEISWLKFLTIPFFFLVYSETKLKNDNPIPLEEFNRFNDDEMRDLAAKIDLKLDNTQDQLSFKIRLPTSTNHNPFAIHAPTQGASRYKFFTMLMGGNAGAGKEEMKRLATLAPSSDLQEPRPIKIDTRRRRLPVTELPERKGEFYLFTENEATHYYGIISEKIANNKRIDVRSFENALEKGWQHTRHTSGVYSLNNHRNGYVLEIRPEGRVAERMFAKECRNNGNNIFTYIFGIYDATHKPARLKKQMTHNPIITPATTPGFSRR